MVIDLVIPCAEWLEIAEIETIVSKSARQAVQAALPEAAADVEVSIVLGSDELIRGLNRQYKNQDKPTNVLSFPSGECVLDELGPKLLGDVILAYETIGAEAQVQGKSISNHACHLTVHGVLHLLGFTHDEEEQAQHMEQLEIDILASLGLPNPYVSQSDAYLEGGAVR